MSDHHGDSTWCGAGVLAFPVDGVGQRSSNLARHSFTCGALKVLILDSTFRNPIPVLCGDFNICFLFNTVVSNQG